MRARTVIQIMLCAALWSAAKTAQDYFRAGAHLFVEGRFPSAAIEVREGLSKYPGDQALQRLLKRIEEAERQQKQECSRRNPGGQNQEQRQDGEQNQGERDQRDENAEKQGNQGNSSAAGQSSSSAAGDQGGDSADRDSAARASQTPDSLREGQLTREQAEELLRNYQQNDHGNKRALPWRGRAIPEKDW